MLHCKMVIQNKMWVRQECKAIIIQTRKSEKKTKCIFSPVTFYKVLTSLSKFPSALMPNVCSCLYF